MSMGLFHTILRISQTLFASQVKAYGTSLDITATPTHAVVVNEGGADVDFRVEGDTVTDVLKIDAGQDAALLGAGYGISRVQKTADYTVLTTDHYIGLGILSGAVTLTIPSALIAVEGRVFIIKDELGMAESFTVTIEGEGGEYIDGATSYIFSGAYSCVKLMCTGTGLVII